MPYDDEQTNYLGQSGLVQDPEVTLALKRLQSGKAVEDGELPIIQRTELGSTGRDINEVIAIDGSRMEASLSNQSDTPRVGFVEIAVVNVNNERLQAERGQQFVSDGLSEEISQKQNIRLVAPGRGLYYRGKDTVETWRQMLFENFQEKTIFGDSLLSYYKTALRQGGQTGSSGDEITLEYCPNGDCDTRDESVETLPVTVPMDGPGICDTCGIDLYPTDRLRIHEQVSEYQDNTTSLGVLMNVIENLVVLASIEHASQADSNIAVIKDGPLAQFDTAAWLGRALRDYLPERQTRQGWPLLCGLAKTGDFAQFAESNRENLDAGEISFFDSSYIYENIVLSRDRDAIFGEKTYYGKNFIFKTPSEFEYVFTVTIPRRYNITEERTLCSRPQAYPELPDIYDLLTELELALHQDGVIPIHLAHDEATIPEFAKKILGELAERHIDSIPTLDDFNF